MRIPVKLDAAGDWLVGLRMASKVDTTSVAVSGWPLLNFRPGRRVNVQDSRPIASARWPPSRWPVHLLCEE